MICCWTYHMWGSSKTNWWRCPVSSWKIWKTFPSTWNRGRFWERIGASADRLVAERTRTMALQTGYQGCTKPSRQNLIREEQAIRYGEGWEAKIWRLPYGAFSHNPWDWLWTDHFHWWWTTCVTVYSMTLWLICRLLKVDSWVPWCSFKNSTLGSFLAFMGTSFPHSSSATKIISSYSQK